jgi:hypothetical protein
MTTYISLDRNALKSLIADDEQFALDLKAAVISEIARRFFDKDAKKIIAAAEPELFHKALDAYQDNVDIQAKVEQVLNTAVVRRETAYYNRIKLTPEMERALEQQAQEIRLTIAAKAANDFEAAYSQAIKTAVDKKLEAEQLEQRIENRIRMLVTQEIARLAEAKFQARLADLKAMIGG